MFGLVLVILAMVSSQETRSTDTPDLCSTVQFDFTQPQSALAAYRACVDVDEGKLTQLHQRFLASWAKFAVDAGVGQAIIALEDPSVRDVLLSDDDWKALHWPVSYRPFGKSPDPNTPSFVAEIALVVALTVLTAMVAVWTLKVKSAVLRGLPKKQFGSMPKESSFVWEPERERLLQDCRSEN